MMPWVTAECGEPGVLELRTVVGANEPFAFCRSCEVCSRGKPASSKPVGGLHPLDVPSMPWLWSSIGILVIYLPSCIAASWSIRSSLRQICCPRWSSWSLSRRLPRLRWSPVHISISSTVGSELKQGSFRIAIQSVLHIFWRPLQVKVGTTLRVSRAHHPHSNGRSEVTNKTVGGMRWILCSNNPNDWAAKSTTAEFA